MNEQYTNQAAEYSIPYLLRQIAAIQAETAYVHEAIDKLAAMPDGDSGAPGSPGNIQGEAKAQALAGIVQCRESTNQQLLSLYEKMYEDLRREPAQ